MALDREELNKRRQAREEERKKRKRAQRLLRLRLAVAVLVLIACGIGLAVVARDTGSPIQSVLAPQSEEVQATETATEAPTVAPTEAPTEAPTMWSGPASRAAISTIPRHSWMWHPFCPRRIWLS